MFFTTLDRCMSLKALAPKVIHTSMRLDRLRGFRESRRCSRDTYPKSPSILEYTKLKPSPPRRNDLFCSADGGSFFSCAAIYEVPLHTPQPEKEIGNLLPNNQRSAPHMLRIVPHTVPRVKYPSFPAPPSTRCLHLISQNVSID